MTVRHIDILATRRAEPTDAAPLRARAERIVRTAFALICVALQACVYLPRTIEVYDPQCQVVARQMTLQEVQVAAIGSCQNQSCLAMVVAVAATTAASVVVSGSIVVVGNVVYWLESQSSCRRAANEA